MDKSLGANVSELRKKQVEFFNSRGMTSKESLAFYMVHGRNFNPTKFKDWHPDGGERK